nr:hypothetical protein [uncultured Campylobacter sp.]
MKKLFVLALLSFFTGCGNASNTEPPLKVEYRSFNGVNGGQFQTGFVVTVTSLADKISVNDITVNRGKCPKDSFSKAKPFPIELEYSGWIRRKFLCTNIHEVTVETNLGSWTFTFK